ncbi:MAG: SoxR reducing system RseC family protein [Sulfuritalea sp.]|nr:SoxR reducing system RseC family protein [Sulfuritalea sp.]
MSPDSHTVEGFARVVRIDAGVAWLEPEQTGGCGSCASAASCGAGSGSPGIGSVANRIAARRFPLDNPHGLMVGERVVIGVDERSLLKASLTAYAIPLVTALTAGGITEGMFGSDLVTMAAMASGLGLGLLAARIAARQLARRGDLAPRFLRRAGGSRGFDATICETMRSSESPAPSATTCRPQRVTP